MTEVVKKIKVLDEETGEYVETEVIEDTDVKIVICNNDDEEV